MLCYSLVCPKLNCWAALIPKLQSLGPLWAGFWQHRDVLPGWSPEGGDWLAWGELAGDPPSCLVLPDSPTCARVGGVSAWQCCSHFTRRDDWLPEKHAVSWDQPRTRQAVHLSQPSILCPQLAFFFLPGQACPGKREQAAFSFFLTHVNDASTHFTHWEIILCVISF